ncbi:MAG TPA: CDP-diacylglycerol--serine O-phosphatidyltransferase [Candidatus Binataceae bacterium]|jgi:CDP-diacylglycerol--serine O-phosphatidyltransferase|nr:CDP-diacylglycerol--serine O-phosphatidyltransferase [Candidatus Binataceae bacterium]
MNRNESRREFESRARMRLISGRLKKQRKKMADPLRRGVFIVPATITSLGLLAGFYSLISSINSHFELAAVMIAIAFICDGLDGRVARLSNSSSQFGIEYDSLSDVVAFGVAPAGLMYSWAVKPLGTIAIVICGLYVVCAALRLARFNVQTGSTDKRRFTGLPVPGAAILIAGCALAYSYFELSSPRTLCALMAPMTLLLGILMISSVPYPSFKSIHPRKRAQVEIMAGVLVVAAMFLAMPQFTFFVVALSYVVSGPILFARGERIQKLPFLHPLEPISENEPGGDSEEDRQRDLDDSD